MEKKILTEAEKQKYLDGAEEIKKYLQLFKETGKANTQKECAKLLALYWQSTNTKPCSKDTFNKYWNAATYFDKLNETTLSNILKTLKFIEKKDLQLSITTIPDEHKILKHYAGYYYFYYPANGEDGNIMKEGCHLEYRDDELYFENQHFTGKFVLEIGYIYLETRQKDENDKPQKCIYLLTPHQVTLNETIDVFTWVALSNAAPAKGYVGAASLELFIRQKNKVELLRQRITKDTTDTEELLAVDFFKMYIPKYPNRIYALPSYIRTVALLRNFVDSLQLVRELPPHLSDIQGTWISEWQEPEKDGSGIYVTSHETITFNQNGEFVTGLSKVIDNYNTREFAHTGKIFRNLYFGEFEEISKRKGAINGRGNCLLTINENCDEMEGYCSWYDIDVKKIEKSAYKLKLVK